MSTKLERVVLAGEGISKPGHYVYRNEVFKDADYDLAWNQESHAISIRDRKTGALRVVDQGQCAYWDPIVAKPVEGKK